MGKPLSSHGHTDNAPMIFLDMDGVLTVEISSWNMVNIVLGIDNMKNYESYKAGKINYDQFLRMDLENWVNSGKAVSARKVKQVLDNIELFPGVKEGCRTLTGEGYIPVIVSGGLRWLAERVAHELGIEHYFANLIMSQGDRILPSGVAIVDPRNKWKIVEHMKNQYKPRFTVSVGDSPDDMSMFTSTDYFISFNNSTKFNMPNGYDIEGDNFMIIVQKALEIKRKQDETEKH